MGNMLCRIYYVISCKIVKTWLDKMSFWKITEKTVYMPCPFIYIVLIKLWESSKRC